MISIICQIKLNNLFLPVGVTLLYSIGDISHRFLGSINEGEIPITEKGPHITSSPP